MENLQVRNEDMKNHQQELKEQEQIKLQNWQENLKKEKREIEWKKLKVLLKEKMNDERLQFIKYEDEQIKKSILDLAI